MSYEIKMAREKREPTWKFVPEMFMYVGPDEYAEIERIRAELSHPEWQGKIHGQRKLYRRGCRGPLCMKDARDYGRRLMRETKNYGDRTRATRAQRFDALLMAYLNAYVERAARRLTFQAGAQKGELTNA